MDPLFDKNLISTKEAAELSGYTSDYIARLARSGKMSARRIGHTWFVDKESLEHFLGKQEDRKIDYARALARAREAEYRAVNSSLSQVTSSFAKTLQVPKRFDSITRSIRSNALALSVASVVIIASALGAQIAVLPIFANRVASTASDIAFGFAETFGDVPSRIAARIEKANSDMSAYAPRTAENISRASAGLASAIPNLNLASLQMAIADDNHSHIVAMVSSAPVHIAPVTAGDIQASVSDAYAFVTSPSHVVNSLAHAYIAVGTGAYAGIEALFSGYRSLIDYSGAQSLALATTIRDTLAATPRLISEADLAFGSAIIDATHAAIGADVSLAYAGAAAAPESARTTVALLGETGNMLATNVARVPALVTTFYLHTTEVPSHLAPAIAQNVFDMEYAVAIRFIDFSSAVSESSLALFTTTGSLAHDGITQSAALTHAALSLVASAPSVFENLYLGALGKSALALNSFMSTPKLAATFSAATPLLAAASPTLSTGEKIALTTYETINGLFDSANEALAFLLGPPSVIVLPNGTPRQPQQQVAVAGSTGGGGISEYFLDKSLASLRSSILATVASMIPSATGPVQVVKNYYTIDNGNSGGGTTNSNSITATNGTFTSLTTNSLSIGSSLSAPYFTATSGSATSTFAGNLTVSGTASTSALTTSALTLSNLTGSTRCLHVDANGVVSVATSDCGSGSGSGTVSTSSSETAGQLPYWTSTSGTPATLGSIATTTLAFSGPFTGASTIGALVGGTNTTITYTG
ncbi:helix-turn-helix domain-containing protein, partial [Candidatus Parcubacteria bacterium]|nr:helix-turn-helix domain-containing protein [Candidatus Parcubacteria bacterium]